MKAALVTSLSGPDGLVVSDVAEPVAGAGEVVVRVRAAALNFLDTLITRGKYQYRPALPFSPAAELAGEVAALGPGVTGLAVGERVCGYVVAGGAREKVAVKAEMLTKVPDRVSDVVASGLSVTYGTAMHGLGDRGALKAGETLAVLGAAGGAGLAAVEVAKLTGARVIAVASSAEKLALCRAHGADDLLDYATSDLKQGLRDLTAGKGPDVIYDCVGGAHAEAALRSLAWAGRFLVVGFAAGAIPRIPLNLVLLKNCDVRGIVWGEMAVREPLRQRAHMERVLDWVGHGQLKPHIHATFPLARIADALRVLDQRAALGKVIVTL